MANGARKEGFQTFALFRLEPEHYVPDYDPEGFLPYTLSDDGKVVYPL